MSARKLGLNLLLIVTGLLLFWPARDAAQTNKHSVLLSWTETQPTGISGYNVYRSTVSGSGYTKINTALDTSTSYTDSTGVPGTKYYYVTTAVDSSGSESGFSNEASAIFLGPPTAPTALAAVSD